MRSVLPRPVPVPMGSMLMGSVLIGSMLIGSMLVVLVLVLTGCATGAGMPDTAADRAAPRIAPPGVDAGFVVLDPGSGTTLAARGEHRRFRSASLVKLLIAVDYLARRGPDPTIPPRDRVLLARMLRASANAPASRLWVRGGSGDLVRRVATALGLDDTRRPADEARWGHTMTSAADVATVYRHLVIEAPDAHREIILGHLRRARRCAPDGRDQLFGIPRAAPGPAAVKQGWSALGPGTGGPGCAPAARPVRPGHPHPSAVMHTTGVVGAAPGRIVVLLTRHPVGTPYPAAAGTVTRMTAELLGSVRPRR